MIYIQNLKEVTQLTLQLQYIYFILAIPWLIQLILINNH